MLHDKLADIIKDLRRCAEQNEADAKTSPEYWVHSDKAVAAEQRRMITILTALLREVPKTAASGCRCAETIRQLLYKREP